ncbi:FHA domain-containing protein FhaB/FipA [Brevibacterium moorei]|uniref:FHA domain-containing protein FhaB/FipA n=1 Tax=Brevibacterium moorei TaxID=2968457 RepID=UPI00211C7CE8|nr:FHA domain-containing protein [Brevibacterium sp. 68QC2CO]MCQ9385746.1 FHA domain-containing protein [Brevibacterium sp. 68QC2CO]
MTELTVVTLRLGFFVLLWLFVLITAVVLTQDIVSPRGKRRAARAAKKAARAGKPATASAQPRREPARQSAPPPVPPTPAAMPRELVVTSGPLVGVSVALGTSAISLGRAGDNTVVLEDDFASGHHARVYPGPQGWILEDLGSTNGTFLGQQRVTGSIQLPTNVPLTVGHTTLELRT